MWSEELFVEMWRVMKQDAILATYSCARMVRDNMSKANLMYDDGPIVGRRGPGTIATKWIN
jgi:tRNA U34 5-methylaminomethyl-2-thiouridine-forming methyltransferase MnmC